MGLETRCNLAQLRLRAYSLLVDEQSKQAQELINGTLDSLPATHQLLELIRLRERQLQITGDNLEGAMELLKDAKEATQHIYTC